MPVSNPWIWAKVREWPLPYRVETDDLAEPPRTCSQFEHNLRKIGDWTDAASVQITSGYRKFIYLKALTGETLTPPSWIDEAWHLHLSFSDDYRAFEKEIGRQIVHLENLPRAEADRTYQRGWELWTKEFDTPPPYDLWPDLNHRLRHRLHRKIKIVAFLFLVGLLLVFGFLEWSAIFLLPFFISFFVYIAFLSRLEKSPETVSRCG